MIEWVLGHSIEIFGALTGILYVILEIKQKIWLWPLGIITSAIYIIVFFNSKFYADMGLQGYYLFISVYGWYWWKRGGKDKKELQLRITRLSKRNGIILSLVTITLFVAIRYVLIEFTDSQIPGWDAFTTSVSVVATWMLARKILEHWVLWIVADIVSLCLYIYKGLYPTVALFSVYTIMAFIGYREWKREMGVSDELIIQNHE